MNTERFFIIILGPTGVGKTDLVDKLCERVAFNVEIVNGDMAQAYTALSIGTAKPDVNAAKAPHHLFDSIATPKAYSAGVYRKDVIVAMEDIWSRGAVPIVVGGSGFYIKSLFFAPPEVPSKEVCPSLQVYKGYSDEQLWQMLQEIDQERAAHIHPHDRYRVERALHMWHITALKPSQYTPKFEPIGRAYVLFLTRERQELYELINRRTEIMFEKGWIEEVKNLPDAWKAFVQERSIIGYPDIIAHLENKLTNQELVDVIKQKTRAYAKRQLTFWRSLKRCLQQADMPQDYIKNIQEINLTFLDLDLYIDQLSKELYTILH